MTGKHFIGAGILVLAIAAAAVAQQSETQPPAAGGPVKTLMPIDWAAAEADRQQILTGNQTFAIAALPQISLTADQVDSALMARTRLPVLVPMGSEYITGVRIFPRPNFYSATSHHDGYSVQVTGSRIAVKLPDEARRQAPRMRTLIDDEGYLVEQTRSGIDLSFYRYGAAYQISIECDKPTADNHCTDENYVRSLAKQLIYVGGTPENGNE